MIAIRPARPQDLALVGSTALPHRVRFLALVQTVAGVDEVLAVGGLVYRPDGTVWISAAITRKARRAKVALHRAGLAVMAQAKASGLTRLYAVAQADEPRAEAWMARCGLQPTGFFEDGQRVWMWQG